MTSDFDIGKITEAFAAAAIDSSRWTSVVDMVSAATGSFGAVIFPNRGALPYIPVCASMFETFDIYVRDGWIDNDERNHGIPLLLEKGVITDLDIWPQEHIQRSAYYQDYLAHRCGLHSFAAVRVGRGENIWALSIQRTEAQGPFSHSELRSLAQLSQNLNSIADTASALAFARGEGALAAFDMVEKAAFLLDRRGDVVRANQAAEALLGDDVFISRGRLSSRSPQATGAFDATIKALLWNDAASSAPSLVFPREGRLPLLVHAIRCPGISESALSSFHALVVMADAESRSLPAVRTLQAGFGLTASEARLAVAMRAGSDLRSEALKLGVSPETTRKHLKAIFAKTGVRRQSDLVAMLGALLPE